VDVEDALIEFFYVDVDRVRSLLAQIQGGVVDSMTSESTHGYEAGAQATVFGIGGHGDFTRESRRGESRSLQAGSGSLGLILTTLPSGLAAKPTSSSHPEPSSE
jgi:hypothetical protein